MWSGQKVLLKCPLIENYCWTVARIYKTHIISSNSFALYKKHEHTCIFDGQVWWVTFYVCLSFFLFFVCFYVPQLPQPNNPSQLSQFSDWSTYQNLHSFGLWSSLFTERTVNMGSFGLQYFLALPLIYVHCIYLLNIFRFFIFLKNVCLEKGLDQLFVYRGIDK